MEPDHTDSESFSGEKVANISTHLPQLTQKSYEILNYTGHKILNNLYSVNR